jgi:citrate lyase beta subunit
MTTVKTTLTRAQLSAARAPLTRANNRFNKLYPGEGSGRQAVHTVYGGAQLFKYDAARKLGDAALRTLETYAPDAGVLGRALGLGEDGRLYRAVYSRVVEKLRREPVEDLRIDFEDGYGNRPDAEEDADAVRCGEEVARGLREKTLPPFIGIRIKPFNEELFARSARTLDLFVSAMLKASRGKVPPGFVITLPKVTLPEHVSALAKLLGALEKGHKLKAGALALELMVEMPQAIIDQDGGVPLPALVRAGGGRCIAAHFGTYDYTAGVSITAAHQTMAHPACDFAKHVMQVSLAGTGIQLSDGATNVMPVGPHRARDGEQLTREQQDANREVVFAAWRISYRHIRHSLVQGFYQGWDLHPAQLPVRYAAMYAFFLEGLEPASARLKAFMDKAAQATLLGDVFDDAATGQGLLNFFLRGIACGAITEDEARATGLSMEELRSRSFLKILEGRKKR